MATIQTRVRLKKDTSENWEDNGSLVLLDGEMAIEGNRNYKIGDGTTEWANLPYANSNPVLITSSSLTLNASHAECFLSCNTSIQITIPSSFVPVGTQIEIYNSSGNTITLLTGAGVTINGKLTSTTQYEVLTLKQINTNTWLSYTNVSSGGGGSSVDVEPLNITENGTYTAPEGKAYSPVIVNVQSSGSENDDVRFFDYDGTLIKSYSADEFVSLESLPENPIHEGLTSQGWNWSLEGAKTFVSKYGGCDIGQMYITDDGKTRLYVHLEKGRLHPYVGFGINGTATIDWGDGNTSTVTGTNINTIMNSSHEYSQAGDYIISIDGVINIKQWSANTPALFWGNNGVTNNLFAWTYRSCVKKIEIGNTISTSDVSGFGEYSFTNFSSLEIITIPKQVGFTKFNYNLFSGCYSLKAIVIPEGVTYVSSPFGSCRSLERVVIPEGVTTWAASFNECSSLKSIIAPECLATGMGFSGCYALKKVTLINSTTFSFGSCYALNSIKVPNGVSSLAQRAFDRCYSLQSVELPDTLTTLEMNSFSNCYSLSSIELPENVTTISSGVFFHCYGLGFIKFKSQTPPTVSASNTFADLRPDCKIYVPQGTLSAYTSATNYPNSSKYTYIEE